jgi:hypothetical protein
MLQEDLLRKERVSKTYKERLCCLNLLSLELRRLHFDLIVRYEMILGLVDLRFNEFFLNRVIQINTYHVNMVISYQKNVTVAVRVQPSLAVVL